MPSILQTALYAAEKHAKQKRRYTDDPYINHPLAVAVMVHSVNEYSDDLEKAALLHDVVEDCGVTFEELSQMGFNGFICDVVRCLTDVYTKDAFPEKNRKDRKHEEFLRWKLLSKNNEILWRCASVVKLADLYDNACSIKQYDPKFWITYREEALEMNKFLYKNDKISSLLMFILQEKI